MYNAEQDMIFTNFSSTSGVVNGDALRGLLPDEDLAGIGLPVLDPSILCSKLTAKHHNYITIRHITMQNYNTHPFSFGVYLLDLFAFSFT